MRQFSRSNAIVATLALGSAAAFAGPPAYYYRQLESLPGGRTMPTDLSESGLIAGASGSYAVGQGPFAFVGNATGGVTNVDTMSFTTSSGDVVNAAGQVAGVGHTDFGNNQWFNIIVRHTPGQGMQFLGCLNPSTNGQVHGINAHGDVVGYWNTVPGSFVPSAIYYSEATGLQSINPATADSSGANDINDSRQIAGWVSWVEGFRNAVVWDNGALIDIGATLNATYSEAQFINNAGVVAGTANIAGETRPFLWTQAGGVTLIPLPADASWVSLDAFNEAGTAFGTVSHGALFDETIYRFSLAGGFDDLGTLAPGVACRIADANDNGDLVGLAMDPAYETVPILFTEATGFRDLTKLTTSPIPWFQPRATQINNAGQIVVLGWDDQSMDVAALLSPVAVGDLNCDGATDILDINAFVMAVSSEEQYVQYYPTCNFINADTNKDGVVNVLDVNSFVALLGE
ncbi:hypothetical protein RAS1_03320 [Phycisphaerae bacterium RAS1]|nr:hypothetical protein RAS1_03320 [Phycisphaerae bacterium RAS1]